VASVLGTPSAVPSCSGEARPCSVPAAPLPLAAGQTWVNVTASQRFAPPSLVGSSLAFDALDNYLVLFGGCTPNACPSASGTWTYSGGFWTNVSGNGPQPPARSFADIVYDSHDNYLVLFGGRGAGAIPLNDTWTFAGGLWTNITNVSSAPSARYGASMAYDRIDAYVVLYGGCGTLACPLNDTYRFVAGAWRDVSMFAGLPPIARYGASFVWDNGDAYAVLFGGCGVVCPLGDTWQFSKGKWAPLTVTGAPTPRAFASMTYDVVQNLTYLFGGNGSAGPRWDTWKFANARWTNITVLVGVGPSARFGMATPESSVAWSITGIKKWSYSFFFGGSNASCLNCTPGPMGDSWVFEPALSVAASALPTVAEVGQPDAFTAIATGGSSPYTFLWQFGDGASGYGAGPVHPFAWAHQFSSQILVSDTAGVTTQANVLVTVVTGPVVTLSIQPNATDAGRPVAFVGLVSGGSSPYSYRWSLGDLTTSTLAAVGHPYAVAGQYPVNLTVTDTSQGRGVAYGNVTIHPLPELTAIASDLNPLVGANVTFSSTVLGGTAPFAYSWNLGDGNSSSSASLVYPYRAAGTFLVQATVVDGVGAVSYENFSVVVRAAPSTVGPGGGSTGPTIAEWLGGTLLVAGIALAVATAALLLLRHRRREPPPLAAAPAGQPDWDSDEGPDTGGGSRTARRNLNRFYRRR
ncbi:MAG: PKD domain-containing protein, partial [Thermoplasmata archaeon]|nr:PKD domain-containing protein [Thermoplasmata archaeon]